MCIINHPNLSYSKASVKNALENQKWKFRHSQVSPSIDCTPNHGHGMPEFGFPTYS